MGLGVCGVGETEEETEEETKTGRRDEKISGRNAEMGDRRGINQVRRR